MTSKSLVFIGSLGDIVIVISINIVWSIKLSNYFSVLVHLTQITITGLILQLDVFMKFPSSRSSLTPPLLLLKLQQITGLIVA